LITGLGQGGAETMLYRLLSNMDNNRFENIVISMTDKGVFAEKIEHLGIPVYCLNMKRNLSSIVAIWRYHRLLKKHHPDIVQAWMYHANAFAMMARFFLSKHQVIFNIRRSLDNKTNLKWLTRCALKFNAWLSPWAVAVIYNSQWSQMQHQQTGFCADNAVYIPNGFDLNVFKPSEVIYKKFRVKHHLNECSKIVGMIARFHSDKNHQGFVEVAKRIADSANSESVFFVLAGKGCHINNQPLLEWIKNAHLEDRFILLGSVESIQVLPAFDVYLSTSWVEGFPNVIGEAMACGVPCVATDVGDTKMIVSTHGYTVAAGQYDELAQQVIFLLKEAGSAQENRRQSVTDRYDLSKTVAYYEQLYVKVKK